MLCDKCKTNEAQVYYTESINGKETKYALCRSCADEMKKDFAIPELIGGTLSGFGSLFGSILAPQKNHRDQRKICDLCGMSFSDFTEEGKAGCPRCYETFADELERTVAGIHGGTLHTGKIPEKHRDKAAKSEKLSELRRQISEAVKTEDYETAALLRDEIRKIENGEEETV